MKLRNRRYSTRATIDRWTEMNENQKAATSHCNNSSRRAQHHHNNNGSHTHTQTQTMYNRGKKRNAEPENEMRVHTARTIKNNLLLNSLAFFESLFCYIIIIMCFHLWISNRVQFFFVHFVGSKLSVCNILFCQKAVLACIIYRDFSIYRICDQQRCTNAATK